MVTSFYEGYNKLFTVKCEIICYLTWWVNTHFGINPFIYEGKRSVFIPKENDVIKDIEYLYFYGLKVSNGTLFVGIYDGELRNLIWEELDDTYGDNSILTMSALWNIMEVLYLYDEKDMID